MIRFIRDWWRAKRNPYIRQKPSSSDYIYVSGGADHVDEVDLSGFFIPCRDQKSTNACTAFATASLIEYHLQRMGHLEVISTLYTWFFGKTYHGWEDRNQGVWLRFTLKSLYKYGFLYEKLMPFGGNYLREPSLPNYEIGLMGKMLFDKTEYQLLEPEEIKDALANELPVVFGVLLNNSFYGNTTGEIKDTTPSGSGHAMLVVGYNDDTQCFKVRNSWGRAWGDNGYCYIPYDYLITNAHDCWTINFKEEFNNGINSDY